MTEVIMTQSAQSPRGFLGLPLGGFGLLTTILLAIATGFLTFFLTTCVAIFALLFWNTMGSHSVNYADSYRYVGLPAGSLALVVSFFVLGALWIRSKMH
jgi:hypothetical protein